jgi:hypothetical protein
VAGDSGVLESHEAEPPAAFSDRVADDLALSNLAEVRKVLSKSLIGQSIVKSSYKYFVSDRSVSFVFKLPQLPIVSILVKLRTLPIQTRSFRRRPVVAETPAHRRPTARPPEPIPGLLAVSLTISIPTPLALSPILLLFLVRGSAEGLLLHNKRVLRLRPVAGPDFDLPVLNSVGHRGPQNLIVKLHRRLTVQEIRVVLRVRRAILQQVAHFPLRRVHHVGDEGKPSASPRVLVPHHSDVYQLSKFFEIEFKIDF